MTSRLFDLLWLAEQELYQRALDEISTLIQTYLSDHAYKENCRVDIVRRRIKDARSILKKGSRENIPDNKVLQGLTDIAGLRIICNNKSDVYKAFELIKQLSRERPELVIKEKSIQDYIKCPNASGYRTLQFILDYSVRYGDGRRILPCEIQIRSVTQDAWATLSHADFYKREEDIPPLLKTLMQQLADQLELANDAAETLREEVEKLIETADITEYTLYTLLDTNYGYKPDRYYLKLHLDNLEQLRITKISEVKNIFDDENLREKIGQIIQAAGGPKVPPTGRDWKTWHSRKYIPYVAWMLYVGAIYCKRGKGSAEQEAQEFSRDYKEAMERIVRSHRRNRRKS